MCQLVGSPVILALFLAVAAGLAPLARTRILGIFLNTRNLAARRLAQFDHHRFEPSH